jgi:hypothetical protein
MPTVKSGKESAQARSPGVGLDQVHPCVLFGSAPLAARTNLRTNLSESGAYWDTQEWL